MDSLTPYLNTLIPDYIFIISFLVMTLAVVGCLLARVSKRWVPRILLLEYCFLVLCSTVIFRNTYAQEVRLMLTPFWNYAEVFSFRDLLDFWEVVLNIVLFIPIGLLLGASFSKARWHNILLTGILLSTSIEALQYTLQKGLCETNDVIHNALGCMIGFVVYQLLESMTKCLEKEDSNILSPLTELTDSEPQNN